MTSDVRLREVEEDDLAIFFDQQQDQATDRMAAFAARNRQSFRAHWTTILGDETVAKQTILYDGQVAGNIVGFDQVGERAVGYWFGRAYSGKDVAARALASFLEDDTTRPLYPNVAKHNIASLRVLRKCGFAIAGEAKTLNDDTAEEIEEYILRLDAGVGADAP